MFLKATLDSKNLMSLNKFLILFSNVMKNKLKFSRILTVKSMTSIKKRITVLKSPHVNKKAQESFEVKNYRKVVIIFSLQYYIIFLILKKLQNLVFNDVKISIQANSNNPKGIKFFKYLKIKNDKANFLDILKYLDVSGEHSLTFKS